MQRSGILVAGCLAALAGLSGCEPATPEALTVSPPALPAGVQGNGYSAVLTADGEAPWTWGIIAGALPAGLDLDHRTGEIAGTPQQSGDFTFTVGVEDDGFFARRGEAQYTLTIIAPLSVATALPNARVMEAYDYTFPTSGGVPPYAFQLIGLPAGLTFNSATGQILGTPPLGTERQVQMSLAVSDSGSPQQSINRTVVLTIKPRAVQIVTVQGDIPAAEVNTQFQVQLAASDGKAPYRWAIIAGALPPGTGTTTPRLNQDTGVIAGRPTSAGEYTFTVQVTDDDSPPTTATSSFTIEVQP